LISSREFQEKDRDFASAAKIELEISLLDSEDVSEVVLLEADSVEALRKTHSRYFNTYEQMKSTNSRAHHDDAI
jgi:hypothetical protein